MPGLGALWATWVRAEILKRNLPFSISEIEETWPGVSRNMVRLVLPAMKAEGLIAPTGKGRGAKWVGINQSSNNDSTASNLGKNF